MLFRVPISSEGSIDIEADSKDKALEIFRDMDCKELWSILKDEGIFARDDLVEEVC